MADKQIKDFAVTPLADTDSIIKQSVTGLTARTTLADIKGNLDGRYAQKGTVIWEDNDGSINIELETALYSAHIYEVHIQTGGAEFSSIMALRGRPGTGPWLTGVNNSGKAFDIAGIGTGSSPISISGTGATVMGIYKIIDLGESL